MSPTEPTSSYAVAIVTGGACGAGREVARRLAARGWAVVVVYAHRQDEAEAAVEEIVAANGAALAVRADVADAVDVQRLFDETSAAFGGVDVVAHTGLETSVVNEQAARRLRHGGAIVSVSSSAGIAPAVARELRALDISVNGLAPGLEPPGADHDAADLLACLDRER